MLIIQRKNWQRKSIYCCKYCEVSDPEINGDLHKHSEWCEYRKIKELELKVDKLQKICDNT